MRRAHVNTATFAGRVCEMSTLQEDPLGRPLLQFSLDTRYNLELADALSVSEKHRCVAGDALAEELSQTVRNGATLLVHGPLFVNSRAKKSLGRRIATLPVEHATLRPDARDTLGALRQASVHVQIVSNIDDDQVHPLIDRLGLNHVVDAVTSSDEALSCKPDPGIYQVALDKADCCPTDVLFVGDSLRHDVEGPAAMGMRTAWMVEDGDHSGPGNIRPDFVVRRLAEVTYVVGLEVGR